MGLTYDKRTAGGGYVQIQAEQLILGNHEPGHANIEADGFPNRDTKDDTTMKMGGSGGYIWIKTMNTNSSNEIGPDARITANGGNGAKKGFGGSGGVIVIDGQVNTVGDFKLATAFGGLRAHDVTNSTQKDCGNGASGTVWLKQLDALLLNNG